MIYFILFFFNFFLYAASILLYLYCLLFCVHETSVYIIMLINVHEVHLLSMSGVFRAALVPVVWNNYVNIQNSFN